MHEMVVQHDVRRRETLKASHRDQAGIARAGADEIDDASSSVQSSVMAAGWPVRPSAAAPERRRGSRPRRRRADCAPTRPPRAAASSRGPRARPRTRDCRRAKPPIATSSMCPLVDRRRQRADRCLATAAQRVDDRALGASARAGRRIVVDGVTIAAARRRLRADLDGDDALSGRRNARGRMATPARCGTQIPGAVARRPRARARRARPRRACAVACRDCRGWPRSARRASAA